MRNLLLVSAALLAGLSLGAPAGAQPRGGAPQGGAYPPIGPNGLPGGSWATVCRNGSMNGQTLSAECKDAVGQYHFTTLSLQNCSGDIGDQNGVLACANGVKGTAGGVIAGNGRGGQNRGDQNRGDQYRGDQYRGDRRDDRRDDNGSAVAGVVAGLLGGALAGQGGVVAPPPPPAPAYGDPRYGDPRYDWRYQQGGYGYGRRPGEWVPIDQRADWLNRQIDRLQRDGRIDYRDARDYRRQLDRIMDRERDMQRFGRFGPRERNELDRRFSDLTEEIRHDARED